MELWLSGIVSERVMIKCLFEYFLTFNRILALYNPNSLIINTVDIGYDIIRSKDSYKIIL